MNGVYIRKLSVEEFTSRAIPFIEAAGLKFNKERFSIVAALVQERVRLLKEVPEMVEFLFKEEITRNIQEMFQKGIDKDIAKKVIEESSKAFEALCSFSADEIEATLRKIAENLALKAGPMFGVIRVAVTGKKITPPLFESIVALGKDTVLKRLRETLSLVSH
jgi:glutamyl-tRNA synthetase